MCNTYTTEINIPGNCDSCNNNYSTGIQGHLPIDNYITTLDNAFNQTSDYQADTFIGYLSKSNTVSKQPDNYSKAEEQQAGYKK